MFHFLVTFYLFSLFILSAKTPWNHLISNQLISWFVCVSLIYVEWYSRSYTQLIPLFEVFNKRYIYHTLSQENSTWMGAGRIWIIKKKGNKKRPGERLDMKKVCIWTLSWPRKKLRYVLGFEAGGLENIDRNIQVTPLLPQSVLR